MRPHLLRTRGALRESRHALAGLIVCAVLATGLACVAVASGGMLLEAAGRYPGPGAEGVPNSAHVKVQLKIGWFIPQKNLDIVVTAPDGTLIEGRSSLDGAGVLSFIPKEPLPAGENTIEVHHRESPAAEENLLRSWSVTVEPAPNLLDGFGGSILLVAREGTSDAYLPEILRAEGFTGFDTVTPSKVSSGLLADHAVVILGAQSSTGLHIPGVESWARSGGELIVMKPESRLASLAGLEPTGEKLENAYLAIDTSRAPGTGLTAESMQMHGGAALYNTALPEVRTIATLSSDPDSPGHHPALTMTEVGTSGGHVAAFSYDLSTSVRYTRQGNPAAAGTERDGSAPIRPNDLFMGLGAEPDFLDHAKIGIPQADEQMRLLSNLLLGLHADTSPLPRFWYLPNGEKAALVMTADDHGAENGTRRFFDQLLALGEPGCDVDEWECPRATSWVFPLTPLTDDEATRYVGLGFDVGAHVSTECEDWTKKSLDAAFAASMLDLRSRYPGLPDQTGHRVHCVAYSDWLGLPKVEQRWGIGLDMNYYNWPPEWIRNQPGYITGSALPMRFGDENGRLLDVFQQESHLVNETWNGSAEAIEALITAAEDERGYYGAFGTHVDFSDDYDQQLMRVATRMDVPMVSAEQLLDFAEGRHGSSFTRVSQNDAGNLTFEVTVDPRASGKLTAMLPVDWRGKILTSLTAGSEPVDYVLTRIKGITYAFFDATESRYEAAYR
jgi:hypothetical protein